MAIYPLPDLADQERIGRRLSNLQHASESEEIRYFHEQLTAVVDEVIWGVRTARRIGACQIAVIPHVKCRSGMHEISNEKVSIEASGPWRGRQCGIGQHRVVLCDEAKRESPVNLEAPV